MAVLRSGPSLRNEARENCGMWCMRDCAGVPPPIAGNDIPHKPRLNSQKQRLNEVAAGRAPRASLAGGEMRCGMSDNFVRFLIPSNHSRDSSCRVQDQPPSPFVHVPRIISKQPSPGAENCRGRKNSPEKPPAYPNPPGCGTGNNTDTQPTGQRFDESPANLRNADKQGLIVSLWRESRFHPFRFLADLRGR